MNFKYVVIDNFYDQTGVELVGQEETWLEECIGGESYDWPHYASSTEVVRKGMLVEGFKVDFKGGAIAARLGKPILVCSEDGDASPTLLEAIKAKLGSINYNIFSDIYDNSKVWGK